MDRFRWGNIIFAEFSQNFPRNGEIWPFLRKLFAGKRSFSQNFRNIFAGMDRFRRGNIIFADFRKIFAGMDRFRRGNIIFAEFSQKNFPQGRDRFRRIFANFSREWTDFAGEESFSDIFRRNGTI